MVEYLEDNEEDRFLADEMPEDHIFLGRIPIEVLGERDTRAFPVLLEIVDWPLCQFVRPYGGAFRFAPGILSLHKQLVVSVEN